MIKTKIKRILARIVQICRISVGLLIMKTGYDFVEDRSNSGYWQDDPATGIFVLVIGLYIVLSSLYAKDKA